MTQKKPPRSNRRIEADTGDRPRLKLSIEADCLSDTSLFAAQKAKAFHVKRKHRDVLGNVTVRAFMPVFFLDGKQLADMRTGSLYDLDSGKCLTGAARLVEGETPLGLQVEQVEVKIPTFNNKRRTHRRAA